MYYKELFKEENEKILERYELIRERIKEIGVEENVKQPYGDYFRKTAEFLLKVNETADLVKENKLSSMSLKELKKINTAVYNDIAGDNYEKSYANPDYAVKTMGEKYGKLLSFLYTEIRGCIVYAYEYRLFDMTINMELFVEVYNYFEEENEYTVKELMNAIKYFINDYSEITVGYRTREMLDTSLSFAVDIIMNEDLSDERYLYYFGEYITENEHRLVRYLNGLTQEEIDSMAKTYTEGFRMGFINNNIDMSKKSIVNIRYFVGFERIVRSAIRQFEEMGLKTTIYRAAVNSINKRQHIKTGYYSTSPNRQYDYDHRFDMGIYMDKSFCEKKLMALRMSYEKYKNLASEYAGPAVIEIFGEKSFEPVNKENTIKIDKKQQKLSVEYNRASGLLTNEYIKSDEYSFTIIAYPIPEIGEDFEEIFDETVKVNNLDNQLYKNIQQNIIDALDKGEYVHILGKDGNRTDLKVQLYRLENKEKETIFENCLADVNIPVGEVFTSPVLKGTNGVLNVSEAYLNELKYVDLELEFEDGKIKKYNCKNFNEDSLNVQFIKENLMYNHETLPIGEFAIGTNTTAYVMGKKLNISSKLPILIAEKTGPHFAVGDTCYKMSEDTHIYNPDGKEIVAKDNEVSILRKTEIEKAYFNCHTDITIPYDEIGDISVYTEKGEKITIIKNGRFVLEGTDELNKPFEY